MLVSRLPQTAPGSGQGGKRTHRKVRSAGISSENPSFATGTRRRRRRSGRVAKAPRGEEGSALAGSPGPRSRTDSGPEIRKDLRGWPRSGPRRWRRSEGPREQGSSPLTEQRADSRIARVNELSRVRWLAGEHDVNLSVTGGRDLGLDAQAGKGGTTEAASAGTGGSPSGVAKAPTPGSCRRTGSILPGVRPRKESPEQTAEFADGPSR